MAIYVQLATTFFRASRLAAGKGDVNPIKTLLLINRSIAAGACWVAVQGGRLAGSMGCLPQEHMWSDHQALKETWLWIDPDVRSFRLVRQLIGLARERARALGLSLFVQSDADAVDASRLGKLYARLGLRQIGVVFVGE